MAGVCYHGLFNSMLFSFCVLLVSLVLTGVIRHYALSSNVLDIPNQRSSHTIPTPRGGGLAIVLAFSCALAYLAWKQQLASWILFVLSTPLLVAAIGFCDDHAHVAARWRLLTHLLAALLALYFMRGFPLLWLPAPVDGWLSRYVVNLAWFGYPLGAVLLVWLLNLFNFMDGTDGIAASEAVFVSLGLAGFLYFIDRNLFSVCVAVAIAALGFLAWNWPKARIFMGDVGSGFLGLLLGILILLAARNAAILLYCGLILFGVFLVDASYTLIVRFVTGQKWYDAHCSHTYQHAAKRYGHLPVLLAVHAINYMWLLPISIWVFLHPHRALLGMIAAYLPLLALAYTFKAGLAGKSKHGV